MAAAAVRVLPSLTWSSLPALKTPRSFRRLPRRASELLSSSLYKCRRCRCRRRDRDKRPRPPGRKEKLKQSGYETGGRLLG